MNDISNSNNVGTFNVNPEYPAAGYAWYVVIILYLTYTLSFVDRAIINFLVEPIRADLLINDFQFSLIQGLAFTVTYSIMGIPLGRLADSRTRRGQLAAGIALWCGMTVLSGKADSYWALFLTRMGVGVGEACLVPCAYSLIADYFPQEKRALPLNVFSGAIMFGALVSPVVGGLISEYAFNAGPMEIPVFGLVKPWQLSFILVGLPGILFVLAMKTIQEPTRKEQRGQADVKATFRYFYRHWKTYGSIIGGTTFGAMTNGAILGWIVPWFSRRYAWNNARIGPHLGITCFIFGTVGLSLAGVLANRYISAGKKAVYIKLMMAAEALVLIPLILAHAVDKPYWVLGCVGGVIFFGGFSAGLGPASLQVISPNEMRGQITAFCFLILNLVAGTVGPSAVGWLTTYVFADDLMVRSSAVIVGIVASVLGLITLVPGLRTYERTAEENKAG
ncbi:MFS transporter [Thermodesulfobacteriota bacterium]